MAVHGNFSDKELPFICTTIAAVLGIILPWVFVFLQEANITRLAMMMVKRLAYCIKGIIINDKKYSC